MKLKIPQLGIVIEVNTGTINNLVIENATILAAIVMEIANLCDGGDGDIRLYDGDKELVFKSSVELVVDPFQIGINTRTILTKIHDVLIRTMQEELESEMQEMRYAVFTSLDRVTAMHDLPLTFKMDFTLDAFLKAVEMKIDDNDLTLIERVSLYLSIIKRFSRQKLFIFVGLRQFLSDSDYDEFSRRIKLEEMHVLLMERSLVDASKITDTTRTQQIVDNDLCLIL